MNRSIARASGLLLLAGLLLAQLDGRLLAQQPFHWQIQPPAANTIGGIAQAVGTYDSTTQRVLWLFPAFPNDRTVEWGPGGWVDHGATPLVATGVVTQGPAIAHDGVGHQTLAFGGFTYPVMSDRTFAWTGSDWTQLGPVHSPPPRRDAGLFFDEVGQHLLLVAGTANLGIGPWLPALDRADTWMWNGSDWSALAPAHPPTAGPCLSAYDSARSRAVLLPKLGSSMWEWDGSDWTEVVPASMPPLTANAGMTYDASRSRVLLHAGATWQWDGVEWLQLTAPDFEARLPIVFHAGLQRSVRFAGLGAGAVWLSANTPASHPAVASPYGAGCGSPDLRIEPDSRPLLGQDAIVRVTPLPISVPGLTTAWVSIGFAPAGGFFWPTPACEWLHTSEIVGLPCTANGQWWLSVPYDPGLLDADVYLQGLALAPGQNDAWLVLSNGLHWRLGDS